MTSRKERLAAFVEAERTAREREKRAREGHALVARVRGVMPWTGLRVFVRDVVLAFDGASLVVRLETRTERVLRFDCAFDRAALLEATPHAFVSLVHARVLAAVEELLAALDAPPEGP